MVSSTWFSPESNLEGKKTRLEWKLQQTEGASQRDLAFHLVDLLVNVKPQRLQLLLFCGSDHLLHLCQLLRFGATGLQRRQDGLNSLGLLQETPESTDGKPIADNYDCDY